MTVDSFNLDNSRKLRQYFASQMEFLVNSCEKYLESYSGKAGITDKQKRRMFRWRERDLRYIERDKQGNYDFPVPFIFIALASRNILKFQNYPKTQ